MSVSEPQARLAVRSVDDLVGLVPYLIGFHPEESLVALVIDEGRVVVTARVDLAAVAEPVPLAALLGRLFERYPAAEGWFLAYTEEAEFAWGVLAGCAAVVGTARLGRLLQVGARSWRADFPEGPAGPVSGDVGAAAAEAAVLGLPARASRQELAAAVAGPPEAELSALSDRLEGVSGELSALAGRARRRLFQRLLRTAVPPGVDDCLRLAVLASGPVEQVVAVRGLTRLNAEQQLALWTAVVRHCPPAHQVAPLGLLGLAAWQNGDGALQMVCLERLDLIDPTAPLAGLLDWLNAAVVPPWDWAQYRDVLVEVLATQLQAREAGSGLPFQR